MPLVQPSSYRDPRFLVSGHLQTILPALFRRVVGGATSSRERIETPDDDFLDLDWRRAGNGKLAILSHGLEGSSRSGYIRGMAAALLTEGWDVLAWNFRGCGDELNRQPRFYHSGDTGDLAWVIRQAGRNYERIDLIGFSLGGNVTLKYLGEDPGRVDPKIGGAVAFSVPCDLTASARRLDQPDNRIYTRRFLRTLKAKVKAKARQMPGRIDATGVEAIRTFGEFDDRYTAPMHGFADARDYWRKSSSRQFLKAIRIPTLLVNARNDPFLPPECFPEAEAATSDHFHLEAPAGGGHVGFASPGGRYWSELRAIEFLAEQ